MRQTQRHPKLRSLTAGQRERVLYEALRLACLSLHKNIEGKTQWWLDGMLEQAFINTDTKIPTTLTLRSPQDCAVN
jgi:hypothetical protein